MLSFLYGPTLTSKYMTTGKIIALIRQTFVGKVTSLIFNMLSRLAMAFLPTGKHLLTSWLLSTSVMSGASVRNSVHGKVHEEGGLAYTKV